IHHIHRDHYVAELGQPGRLAALMLETLPLRLLYGRTQFETISRAAADEIVATGIAREQIEVIYVGTDVDTSASDLAARSPEPTILYLGRLKRYKRIEVVFDVLEANPGATLDLAGDGDHRDALLAEIRARGLERRVRVHGHVNEERKRELYRR